MFKKLPSKIASVLVSILKENDLFEGVSVAGPGFINMKLSATALLELADESPELSLKNETIVAEYYDSNPFKVLHAGHLYTGHLYTLVIGDERQDLR